MQSLNIPHLLDGGWKDFEFSPFKPGLDIHYLLKGGEDEPTIALLKYAPGAKAPKHRHLGMETILVLDGLESDENGDYPKGSLAVNPTGSEHSVWSENGAIILIQWNRPVEFI